MLLLLMCREGETAECTYTYDVDEDYTYAPDEEYTYDPCSDD